MRSRDDAGWGAIMLVLAEHFRTKVDLLAKPGSAGHREILQWLFFANSTLDAADADLQSNAKPSPFAPLVDVLAFLEKSLTNKIYIAAEKFTIADIALSNNLKYVYDHISEFPRVASYFKEQTNRPAYRKLISQTEYKGNR